jgi:hypothetical protein
LKLLLAAAVPLLYKSVYTSSEQEMLQNWGHLQLRKIGEQLVKFVLARAVNNQVCAETEDASRQD